MTAKIINLSSYESRRPKRSCSAGTLSNSVCVLVEFADVEKNQCTYDITGDYIRTKMGRYVLTTALASIICDILAPDGPEAILSFIESLQDYLNEEEY